MKGIIIYKGKYGATRQYATWLADELQLPVVNEDEVSKEKLKIFDYIVIAGSVYIGKWLMSDWMKQHMDILEQKKLFLLVVCGTPASQGTKQAEIARSNVPASLYDNAEIYFLPGRVVIKNLSWKDRFLLYMGARLEKDPATKARMLQDIDNVSKDNLIDVTRRIKGFEYSMQGSSRVWRLKMIAEN